MEIRHAELDMNLTPEMVALLSRFRTRRNFNAVDYIKAKAILLNDYMTQAKLKACVIAVSGGVDSAVVLGIVNFAKSLPDSPIEKIVGVCLPSKDTNGVTGQEIAESLGQEVCRAFDVEPTTIDLKDSFEQLRGSVEHGVGIQSNTWAQGQLVSYLRTPAYYYITSLLSANGLPAIVVGTTNLSEGGYLGYFGKASDGMVDVQLISDIYKSEVYTVASELHVPSTVCERAPTGDMFDATTDEVVFGASYDFLEFWMEMRRIPEMSRLSFEDGLPDPTESSKRKFRTFKNNLMEMHQYNKHKYLGRSPAVHLDIMECVTANGWDNSRKLPGKIPDASKIVAPFELPSHVLSSIQNWPISESITSSSSMNGGLIEINDFLEETVRNSLLNTLKNQQLLPVPVNGIRTTMIQDFGSFRASTYNQKLADQLWERARMHLPAVRIMDETVQTDYDGHSIWKPVGVSPLFRFIVYPAGGKLIPHYDAPYVVNERERTLMSMVIYLNGDDDYAGGQTQFIKDPQAIFPVDQRDLGDWEEMPRFRDIEYEIQNKAGKAIIFDHRILHAGAEVLNGTKFIVRTDIIFERCDWYNDAR